MKRKHVYLVLWWTSDDHSPLAQEAGQRRRSKAKKKKKANNKRLRGKRTRSTILTEKQATDLKEQVWKNKMLKWLTGFSH